MKQFELSGSPRESVGRQDASALRNAGRIPGVMYGGTEQVHFSVSEIDMNKIMGMSDTLQINLSLGNKTYSSILQEVQRHPVTDKIVHVDFLELVPGKAVKTSLPVRVTGNSEGVKAGGRLEVKAKTIKVRTLPKFLKEFIEVNIETLELNANVRVQDIQAPDMEIMNSPRIPIASVVMTRQLKQEEATAAKETKKK